MEGQSPYTVQGFFSPLPLAWAMLPFGLLPFPVAYGAWTALNLGGLIALTRRQALKALLFLPVVFAVWVGQVDLLVLWLGMSGGWLGLALTTLKPQLAIWIVPYRFGQWWLAGERKKILYTLLAVLVIYGLPTLVWPGWWSAWRSSTPSIFSYAEHASSLFGVAALVSIPAEVSFLLVMTVAVAGLVLLKPFSDAKYWPFAAAFNPVSNIYSLCILVGRIDWVAIGASWLLLPVALYLHTGLPWAVVPLYLLLREYDQRKSKRRPSTLGQAANAPTGRPSSTLDEVGD